MATSLRHYGVIDYQYFFKMLPIILGLSLVPAVVVWVLKAKKWYFSIGLGALVGFLSAVIYVQFVNSI